MVETAALLFLTRMLAQSDMLAVLAADVAHYYAEHGMVAILPLPMPCRMDDFGLILRTDRLPSPATQQMAQALREAAREVYALGVAERSGERSAERSAERAMEGDGTRWKARAAERRPGRLP